MPSDQPDFATFEPEPEEAGEAVARPLSAEDRAALASRILRQAQDAIGSALSLLENGDARAAHARLASLVTARREGEEAAGRVVEGVFDGEAMIGNDGHSYPVPPNYASKSKLVEGDVLKLSIRADGAFLFKQVGPVERRRLTGLVAFDPSTDSYLVACGSTVYKVLTASVTFHKASPGDEAVILVPKGTKAVWAALENVMKD